MSITTVRTIENSTSLELPEYGKSTYTPFEYPDVQEKDVEIHPNLAPISNTFEWNPVKKAQIPESRKNTLHNYYPITVKQGGNFYGRILLQDKSEYYVGPFKYAVSARRAVLRAQAAPTYYPKIHQKDGKFFGRVKLADGFEYYIGPFNSRATAGRAVKKELGQK